MGDCASCELGKRHPYPGEIARILGQKPSLGAKPSLGPKPNLEPTPNLEPRPNLGPKQGELRLDLGLDPKRKSVSPQAWKDAIGPQRVPARLALLPEAKPR